MVRDMLWMRTRQRMAERLTLLSLPPPAAIKIALDKAPIGRNTRIVILTDSKLSVNIINEYYFKWINNGAVTNTGQTPANWGVIQDIMDLIFERRDRGQKVRVDYVPGHVGNEGNEKAHK